MSDARQQRKLSRRRARPRRRRALPILRHRARGHVRLPHAGGALNALMQEADIFKVGRRHYLVAPLSPELVDTLILAAAAGEDDEDDDSGGGNVEDEGELEEPESDGLDDVMYGGDCALGWANEGSQEHLSGTSDESEESDEDSGIDDEPHDEPNQDLEPSLAGIHAGWSQGVNACDLEGDCDDDGVDADGGGI